MYVKLFEFWGLVIQVFQMQIKGITFGDVPFLTMIARAKVETMTKPIWLMF